MKNDDLANIPEINTISPAFSSKGSDQVVKSTSGTQASSSSGSSGSSASDLRRRLQDLPSSDEFTPLADRVAALGRRISRKRELFLRLHGAADRIEESDEWEEKEERAEVEGSLGVLRRPMDARARRRARVRLGSSRLDDKAMVISRPAFRVTHCDDDEDEEDDDGDNNHDKLNPVESTAARSTQEYDYSRLPTIEPILCRQPRPTSLSEPSTARFPHRVNIEARDARSDVSFAPRNGYSRSTDLRSVAPFSFSHLRPKRRIGGYRPTPGVFLRNLSSGSESSHCHPSTRKISDPIATLELSSPEFKSTVVDEPTKKMPIMSARSDITESILPNLLPSTSLRSDDRQIYRDDSRCYTEFEDSYDEEEESYRSHLITSEVQHNDVEDLRFILDCSTRRSDNSFCEIVQDHSPEIIEEDVFDMIEKPTSTCTREADDSPRLARKISNDTTEEVLSSQTSEPFRSEDHSRSSHTPKMYRQKEAFSSGRFQNDTDLSDKYDQDITTVTDVPMLALNSADISCSTSAYSRECSAVQPLDAHELIEALSAVSLQERKEQKNHVRKHGDLQGEGTIDASCRISYPVVKGETWRIPPESSTSQSPGKILSRVASRIPVRVSSSKIVSSNATKLSECRANSESSDKIANYEEVTDPNDVPIEVRRSIVSRQLDVNSFYRVREDPLQGSRKDSIEVTIVKTRPNTFMSKEETECQHASLPSSSPLSPQSVELEDNLHYRAQFLAENRRGEKSCPLLLYPDEIAFPNDLNFLRVDDDVQSRSDHSTSRRSAETTNIMRITGSSCLSICRNDANAKPKRSSPVVESANDARKNITWRTEDEWVSNNDEEYPDDENDKAHCGSRDGKPDVYLRTMKCFGSTLAEVRDPSETPQFLQSNRSTTEKIVKGQGVGEDLEPRKDKLNFDQSPESSKVSWPENLLQLHRTQETFSFAARISSSTLNLNNEPKRKKRKSQERFPFTISEAPAAFSAKRDDTIDYQVSDKDLRGEKMEEKTTRQLKMHPSITRLANAGLEDTVADILCCVAQDQKEDELSSRSRIKGFMQMFSSKFRKSSKQRSDVQTAKPAEVIYKNRACQVDSRANSCSGHSSAEEIHGTNCDKFSNRTVHRITRSNPTLVFGENVLKKTSSLTAISQDHPYRRHDRDDLWVRGFKETPLEAVKNNETLREQDQEDDSKDRYSIFLAKNFQSDRVSVSNIDRDDSPEIQRQQQRDALISGHVTLARRSKRSIDVDIVPEIDEIEEVLSGCLCFRLCRLITPKHRLSIRNPSSKMKNSGPFLWKRKK